MNLYSKIGKILKEIEENKISFKNAIYKYAQHDNERHFKTIYKLVVEILKLKKVIEGVIDTFFNDCVNDKHYFMVLIYEKYFSEGKKRKIGGKLMKLLKEKDEYIKKYINDNGGMTKSDEDQNNKMYFRINKQKVEDLEALKYQLINLSSVKDDFIENLYYIDKKENSNSIKVLFELRDKSQIIIQTKSSCLPAYILKKIVDKSDLKDNYEIIDSCSAPGNKTLQLAEYFPDSIINAFEINEGRFKLLLQNINKYNFNKNINTNKYRFFKYKS
jgi:16S rRNA C967 or C1407 C5-methylase (RsmB/RsmF family)